MNDVENTIKKLISTLNKEAQKARDLYMAALILMFEKNFDRSRSLIAACDESQNSSEVNF